jgi:hypothetical protein
LVRAELSEVRRNWNQTLQGEASKNSTDTVLASKVSGPLAGHRIIVMEKCYTVKKSLSFFSSPAGMQLTKLSLDGKNLII